MSNITDEDKQNIYNCIKKVKKGTYQNFTKSQKLEIEDRIYAQQRIQEFSEQKKTLEVIIQEHPPEWYVGLQLINEDPKENPFGVSDVKLKLKIKIRESHFIDPKDKDDWIQLLENTHDINDIMRIDQDYQKAVQQAQFDDTAKTMINTVCRYLTANYFNGRYLIPGTETHLPPMLGCEEDFIDFYESTQVQQFLTTDMRGVKIQRLVNNPGIQLMIRLTMRAIKNNDQMKTDAAIYGTAK